MSSGLSHFGRSFSKWLPSIADTVTRGLDKRELEDKRLKIEQEKANKQQELDYNSATNYDSLVKGKKNELNADIFTKPKATEYGIQNIDVHKPLFNETELSNAERGKMVGELNTKDYRAYQEYNRLEKADKKAESDKLKAEQEAKQKKYITRSGGDGLYQFEIAPDGSVVGKGKLVRSYKSGRDKNGKLSNKWLNSATNNVLKTLSRAEVLPQYQMSVADLDRDLEGYEEELKRYESKTLTTEEQKRYDSITKDKKRIESALAHAKSTYSKEQARVELERTHNNNIIKFNAKNPTYIDKLIKLGGQGYEEGGHKRAMEQMLREALKGKIDKTDLPMLRTLIMNNARTDPATTEVWELFRQQIIRDVNEQ